MRPKRLRLSKNRRLLSRRVQGHRAADPGVVLLHLKDSTFTPGMGRNKSPARDGGFLRRGQSPEHLARCLPVTQVTTKTLSKKQVRYVCMVLYTYINVPLELQPNMHHLYMHVGGLFLNSWRFYFWMCLSRAYGCILYILICPMVLENRSTKTLISKLPKW